MGTRRIGSLKGKTDFDKAARAVHEMQPPPDIYFKSSDKPKRRHQLTRHERIAKRVEEIRRQQDRLGRAADIAVNLMRSDVRYLEGSMAGIWVRNGEAYDWWTGLHWQEREAWISPAGGGSLNILSVSQADIDQTAEDQAEFFKRALPNPALSRNEKCCNNSR